MSVGYEDRNTDADWSMIADREPFWGVLSTDEYRGQVLSEAARARFFASGQTLIDNIFGFVRRHIDAEFAPDRSLDFGCGVGRLLIPICRLTKSEAVGVDVAPRMLAIARDNCRDFGINNATLLSSDDKLSQVSGEFGFINSYIVLQHIPPARGYGIISRLLSLLSVGGVGSIQVTYAKSRRFFLHEEGRAKYYRREGDALIDLVPVEREPPPGTVTMYDYDLNRIFAAISSIAGQPVMSLPTNDDDHLGVHFLFKKSRS